jgi:hypothetical protein
MRFISCSVLVSSFIATSATAGPSSAPLAIYRWWQPADRDWVSIATGGNEPLDPAMIGSGYSRYDAVQFYGFLIGTGDMIAVYRWWHSGDRDWVTIPEGSISDSDMIASGYSGKTFQFYAYPTARPGTVAVYRWWQPADRDWITLADGELSDATMIASGYQKSATPLFYASRTRDAGGGYFSLAAGQMILSKSPSEPEPPHTLSVVEANVGGYRYWGYSGMTGCGGVGIARSNDLVSWERDTQGPSGLVPGGRWPTALFEGGIFHVIYDADYCGPRYIAYQTSSDGRTFSSLTVLVAHEPGGLNQNPALFKDPVSGRYYLYWFRQPPNMTFWEIRVKSATSIAGLASATSSLLAHSPVTVAAPQVMYRNNTYYMATETYERQIWKTRILTASTPDGLFEEVPGNPVLGDGVACFFQHIFDDVLHAYYCKDTGGTWTLNHLTSAAQ